MPARVLTSVRFRKKRSLPSKKKRSPPVLSRVSAWSAKKSTVPVPNVLQMSVPARSSQTSVATHVMNAPHPGLHVGGGGPPPSPSPSPLDPLALAYRSLALAARPLSLADRPLSLALALRSLAFTLAARSLPFALDGQRAGGILHAAAVDADLPRGTLRAHGALAAKGLGGRAGGGQRESPEEGRRQRGQGGERGGGAADH